MENGEWNEVGLGLDTCPLKDKTTTKTEKLHRKPKSREKNRKLGAGGHTAVCPRQHGRASGTTGRGDYHGPWWRPWPASGASCPVRSPVFLNAAFWCMSGPRALPWIIHIGPHFVNLLDMVWADLLHFLLTLGSICINLQPKSRTSQNKRNRRNRGVNHKIKHINA